MQIPTINHENSSLQKLEDSLQQLVDCVKSMRDDEWQAYLDEKLDMDTLHSVLRKVQLVEGPKLWDIEMKAYAKAIRKYILGEE